MPDREGSEAAYLDPSTPSKRITDRREDSFDKPLEARTAVLAGEGDAEGAAIWRQITAAVEELQRERRPDEPVN